MPVFGNESFVSDFIAVTDVIVISVVGGDAEYELFFYDNIKNYKGRYSYTDSKIYVEPTKHAYIRIMVRNQSAPNEAISADYCNNNISITKSIWSVSAIEDYRYYTAKKQVLRAMFIRRIRNSVKPLQSNISNDKIQLHALYHTLRGGKF
jgi:hypothetical protein